MFNQKRFFAPLMFFAIFLNAPYVSAANNEKEEWYVVWPNGTANKFTLTNSNGRYSGIYTPDSGRTCQASGNKLGSEIRLNVECENDKEDGDISLTGTMKADLVTGRYLYKNKYKGTFEMATPNKYKKIQQRTQYKIKKEKERKAREERERHERACDSYYPGRVGRINSDGWLATEDGFIVRYVNKDRRMVTIEGTTGGNTLDRGSIKEMSCSTLQHYER